MGTRSPFGFYQTSLGFSTLVFFYKYTQKTKKRKEKQIKKIDVLAEVV
jgi:HJR/Mrr/RecB family endonuclease